MVEIGMALKTGTATGSYVKVPLGFKAVNLKMRTATDLTVSYDGKNDHAKILLADGLVDFRGINKSVIWVKGTGAYEITAWDGN